MFQNLLFIMNIIKGSDFVKLIVGLGNPGNDYSNTRHNIGFMFLDSYINHRNIDSNWKGKFNGLFLKSNIDGTDVIFLKPQTFMNLSGDSVRKIVDYFDIDISDILVISDDLDLNIGNFKLKTNGSSGGHNGLKDIESKLGTSDFKRLKIGISNDKKMDTKDYVLGKFTQEENRLLNDLFDKLFMVVDDYFNIPFSNLMNNYNSKNK